MAMVREVNHRLPGRLGGFWRYYQSSNCSRLLGACSLDGCKGRMKTWLSQRMKRLNA
jgi:hypothetical protein